MIIHIPQKYYINILIQFCFLIQNVYLFDIIIENTEQSLTGLQKAFESNTNYEEGVNLYFPEPYYDLSPYDIWSVSVNVEHPINCISTSANKTILDYGETQKFSLNFFYILETLHTVTFSGFIFKNLSSNPFQVTSYVYNNAFHIIFDNCEFINFKGQVFSLLINDFKCILKEKDFYQIEFNNCIFSYVIIN
ncbi:hypothetical protein PIROE2DRAFT_17920 [Piromyces sp. E2]|nr:hypothetical protein PIROE2DRAFT_17920 [Piromyces sp. E2]|eukprot:OUM57169.1 hypothetical protein PIROE2DRAFT_17920 [Piromyces sp. E2]